MAGIQALGAHSGPAINCCFHRVLEPFASEVHRFFNASLRVDTFKLNKGGVLKFDAFCEQSNYNTLWLPDMDKNLLLLTATLFHGKNIHLWYILLYQTSDNLQIIHVRVSHFVIYEKNILITLRFVAKKKSS